MAVSNSDTFVFFGATGDLAFKQIFPALQAMARRGDLDIPVIGVARDGWTLRTLHEVFEESAVFSASRAAARSTTRSARSATWCRTTCCR
jgi:glucose-6-phosphate 1-dehydrogenase